MIKFDEKAVPALPGESQGRTAVILTPEQLSSVDMRNNVTLLPKGAIIEFIDRLVVKAQKRRATDAEDAPKNYSILCAVDGKQRFIGLGTFTRRDFNKADRPFISPISKDVPGNGNVVEFYDAFKDKKLVVADRVSIMTNDFNEAGDRLDTQSATEYPVLEYAV